MLGCANEVGSVWSSVLLFLLCFVDGVIIGCWFSILVLSSGVVSPLTAADTVVECVSLVSPLRVKTSGVFLLVQERAMSGM